MISTTGFMRKLLWTGIARSKRSRVLGHELIHGKAVNANHFGLRDDSSRYSPLLPHCAV